MGIYSRDATPARDIVPHLFSFCCVCCDFNRFWGCSIALDQHNMSIKICQDVRRCFKITSVQRQNGAHNMINTMICNDLQLQILQ